MPGTDKAWELWGQLDPYYGVVTDNRYKRKNSNDFRDEFFASGENYVEQLLNNAESRFGNFKRDRALDFGCGVGRLVIPFAKRFSAVVGVDISDAMIAEAKTNCAEFGIDNASFVKSDDGLSQVTGSFDFINSYVVLQHIPTARGMKLIDLLLGKLNVGGLAMLHVSVERRFSLSVALKYFAKHHIPGARHIFNMLTRERLARPSMEMNNYPLLQVLELFNRNGISEVNVSLENFGDVISARLTGRHI